MGWLSIYADVMLLIALALGGLSIYAMRRKDVPGSQTYGWLLIAISVYLLMYALDIQAENITLRLALRQVTWITIICMGVLHLIFVLQYTSQQNRLNRWLLLGLCAVPVLVTLVNLTNPWHHLFFTGYEINAALNQMTLTGGPVRIAAQLFNTLLLALGGILLLLAARRAAWPKRQQYLVLTLAVTIPLIATLLLYTGFVGDFTQPALALTAVLIMLAIYRFRFLDLAVIAQRALVQNMPDGILVLDQHGAIANANPAMKKLLGLSDAALGQPLEQVFAHLPGFLNACQAESGQPVEIEVENANPPLYLDVRSVQLTNEKGQPLGQLVQVRDVTYRKQAEEQMRLSELNFRQLFEANPFPLAISRRADSSILMANPACRLFFGISPEAISTARALDFYSNPLDREQILIDLETAGKVRNRQMEVVTQTGERLTVLANLYPFNYHNQDCLLIGLADLTEQKQAENALLQQQHAISVMEERERMARELHDTLGQALSYVGMQSHHILEAIDNGEISTAAANLARLITIVDDTDLDMRRTILDLKSDEAQQRGFFPALRDYLERFSETSGIKTLLSLPEQEIEGLLSPANEVQLLRVIQELMNNIRKHSQATTAQVIMVSSETSLDVIVADNGVGFDTSTGSAYSASASSADTTIDTLPAGSVPFSPHPENPDQPGHHFGLQIIQERVQIMNGELKIRSTPGAGTQALMKIPLQRPVSLQPLIGLKFLLVDDHELILEGLTRLLNSKKLRVAGLARNGQEAARQALEVQPDIILMDMHLPDMSGARATQLIKQSSPQVKVIILTISSSQQDFSSAVDSGADGYLLKNLPPETFLKLLTHAVQGEFALDPSLVNQAVGYQIDGEGGTFAGKWPAPRTHSSVQGRLQRLTERQRLVLSLTAEGKLYKEIAARLNMSEAGVKYHMEQILERLEVSSRSEAIALAYQGGLARERRQP